jgi:hypothetical protein
MFRVYRVSADYTSLVLIQDISNLDTNGEGQRYSFDNQKNWFVPISKETSDALISDGDEMGEGIQPPLMLHNMLTVLGWMNACRRDLGQPSLIPA